MKCTSVLLGLSALGLAAALACSGGQQVDGDVLTTGSLTPDAGCTPRSQANEFPVKVLVLVENSGAMCVADPPGTTGTAGFCDQVSSAFDAGVPGRFLAVQHFLSANAARLNVQVAVLPYGARPGVGAFAPVSSTALTQQLTALPHELGTASDLQSALAAARDLLEQDMVATTAALRARSRYLVVLLSTGLPFPRCAANDTRTVWASQTMPDGVWADQSLICNDGCDPDGGSCPPGLIAGGDRNQIGQLGDLVDQIMALKDSQLLGDIRVHTREVLSQADLDLCGVLCGDLFAPVGALYARSVGQYTLELLAQHGQGSYAAPVSPQDLDLSSLPTTEFTQLCAP